MNDFYREWAAYQNEFCISHEVVCFAPLVGYFVWRADAIYRCEPSFEIRNRGDRRMGTIWQATPTELSELDFAIEKATCHVIAIPFSGLHGVEELCLMEGNGKGGWHVYYDDGLTRRAADLGALAHAGDRCQFCGPAHDDVSVGVRPSR
jgi:hypothetical protein